MKVIFNAQISGWILYGLLGKYARWFLGFSTVNKYLLSKQKEEIKRKREERIKHILENDLTIFSNHLILEDLITIYNKYGIFHDILVIGPDFIKLYNENKSFLLLGDGKIKLLDGSDSPIHSIDYLDNFLPKI